MNAKLLLIGLLIILFLCGLLAVALAGMLPRPAEDPAAWAHDAQVASTNRLFGFLGFLAFGGGCWQLPALLICLGLFVFLMARAAGADGGNLQ